VSVTVITDTGSDLTGADATRLGIEVVPLWIVLGEDRYRDGIDIDRATFFRRVGAGEIPTTAPPSPEQFHDVFARVTGAGNDVVAIVLSSGISQTYANALAAAKEFGARVQVVDSLGSAGTETLLALYALELAKRGTSAAEIAKRIDPKALKCATFFAMHDLATLGRSGRLPQAVVALGSLTKVSLVLRYNEEGKIVPAGQSFSFEKTCELRRGGSCDRSCAQRARFIRARPGRRTGRDARENVPRQARPRAGRGIYLRSIADDCHAPRHWRSRHLRDRALGRFELGLETVK
jgi:DegV family protein with EDD domain